MQRMVARLLLAVAALLAVVLGLVLVPRMLYPPLSATELRGVASIERRVELQQAQSNLQSDTRALVLQGLGGILVTAGVIATWRQLQISRDGQITERFTRAVDQLGSAQLNVRLGGIYALERIAQNSRADRAVISEVLTAFVRVHSPWPAQKTADSPTQPTLPDEQIAWLSDRAPDVQAAMHVLGRRPAAVGEVRLQLARVDLRRSYLSRARLSSANIRHASLAGAWLRQIHLEDGDLVNIDARHANLEGAFLVRAKLRDANLRGACLAYAGLLEALLWNADLREADLRGADLRGADLRNADLHEADLTGVRHDTATNWPDGFDATRLHGAEPSEDDEPSGGMSS